MAAFAREYDPAKRKLIADTIERGIIDDAPTIVSKLRPNLFARSSDLRGLAPSWVYPFGYAMNIDI